VKNIIDKLLLFLYSIVFFIVAGFTLVVSSSWISIDFTQKMVENLYFDKAYAYPVIITSIVILLMSVRFIWVILRSRYHRAKTINQRNEFGDIQVNIETIENLSLKAINPLRGFKELKSRVKIKDQHLVITVRAHMDDEASIPELSEEIQSTVKSYVEDMTGITVEKVHVYISNFTPKTPSFNTRVE
jgi:uncharacterized alkaline shock family protein YloU